MNNFQEPFKGLSPRNVTAIVCTRNAEKSLQHCLDSLRGNDVGELLVVDGGSNDRTREIALNTADDVADDPGTGLAQARIVGLSRARCEFVLFAGPDNVFPPGSVATMLQCLSDNSWTGVSCCTEVQQVALSYLNWAMNVRARARFFPGSRPVVGTPVLFQRAVLAQYSYDPAVGYSDDSDLCDRMRRNGHTFGISSAVVREPGRVFLADVWRRYVMYGRGDSQYYAKYSPQWTFSRKVRSVAHPLRSELAEPLRAIGVGTGLRVLPFLVLITAFRYVGWALSLVKGRSH